MRRMKILLFIRPMEVYGLGKRLVKIEYRMSGKN